MMNRKMKVAIYGKSFKKNFYDSICNFFTILNSYRFEIIIYDNFHVFLTQKVDLQPEIDGTFAKPDDLQPDIDLLFSIGGDGTFLDAIAYVNHLKIPIIGINSGRLGFLASIAKEEIDHALAAIVEEKYSFEERTLIQLDTKKNLFGNFNYALNELTIHRKDSASMITIHTYIDDEFLNSYWADGLIIATPTGSTAYSLSVGGPIIVPNTQNFVISPIAPHNLTVRPIVVSDKHTITLHLESRNPACLATLDHRSATVNTDMELVVKKADFTIRILKPHKQSFYKTLRNKLMWGMDKRN